MENIGRLVNTGFSTTVSEVPPLTAKDHLQRSNSVWKEASLISMLVSESKSSAVLHGIAMEGRATAIFQFDGNIHKILKCFSSFQTFN